LRALSLVRAVAGGVRARVVAGRCSQDSCQCSAAAEDRPAGRGAVADAVAGGSVPADLGAESGGAGCAAVAGASAQAGAGADASEEPVAGAGAGTGSTAATQVVECGGTGRVGEAGVAALRGGAAGAFAGSAGPAGSGDQRTEPASGRRSEAAAGGGEVDDASGSGAGDGVGHGADAGTGGAVRAWAQSGQLLWADSERAFQRRAAEAGTHQQARQFVSAFFAGGSGTERGTLRRRTGPFLSPPGSAQTSRAGQSSRSQETGDAVVPDVARRLELRATMQGRGAGEPESFCGGTTEAERLSGQPASLMSREFETAIMGARTEEMGGETLRPPHD